MELNLDTSGQRGGGHHGGDDSKGKFGFDLNIIPPRIYWKSTKSPRLTRATSRKSM
jgi:hypothetical protein